MRTRPSPKERARCPRGLAAEPRRRRDERRLVVDLRQHVGDPALVVQQRLHAEVDIAGRARLGSRRPDLLGEFLDGPPLLRGAAARYVALPGQRWRFLVFSPAHQASSFG